MVGRSYHISRDDPLVRLYIDSRDRVYWGQKKTDKIHHG